jgi:hypothetical protein
MRPISNKDGLVVGWLENDNILDGDNTVQGTILGEKVLTPDKKTVIGEFDSVFFRDFRGDPVAFVGLAPSDTNPVPELAVRPPSSIMAFPFSAASMPVMRVWSRLKWDDFLHGHKQQQK